MPRQKPVETPEASVIDDEPTVEELFGEEDAPILPDPVLPEPPALDEPEEEKLPEGCVRNAAGDIIRLRDAGLQPVTNQG